jgi:hypothetical protein
MGRLHNGTAAHRNALVRALPHTIELLSLSVANDLFEVMEMACEALSCIAPLATPPIDARALALVLKVRDASSAGSPRLRAVSSMALGALLRHDDELCDALASAAVQLITARNVPIGPAPASADTATIDLTDLIVKQEEEAEAHAMAMGLVRRGFKRRRPAEEVHDDDAQDVVVDANGAAEYVTWNADVDAALEAESASFAAIDNKWAVAIAPSIDMQMRPHGQEEPSSSLWFSAIRASTDMQCAYSVLSTYRNVEIRGPDSLNELEQSIRQWLPAAMRGPRQAGGALLPTSLFLIVHGVPGHVVLGGAEIPVLTLLERVVSWLPEEARPWLQHVHLDSCRALHGIFEHEKHQRTSIRHITLTGFTVNTKVASAQVLGQKFLRDVSNMISDTSASQWAKRGLSAALLRQAKVRLQDRVGRAPQRDRASTSNAAADPDAVVGDERMLVEALSVL